jgi:formate-dependent phosphoribosylglycinamide formyltransferase (GAR transformylase)
MMTYNWSVKHVLTVSDTGHTLVTTQVHLQRALNTTPSVYEPNAANAVRRVLVEQLVFLSAYESTLDELTRVSDRDCLQFSI